MTEKAVAISFGPGNLICCQCAHDEAVSTGQAWLVFQSVKVQIVMAAIKCPERGRTFGGHEAEAYAGKIIAIMKGEG